MFRFTYKLALVCNLGTILIIKPQCPCHFKCNPEMASLALCCQKCQRNYPYIFKSINPYSAEIDLSRQNLQTQILSTKVDLRTVRVKIFPMTLVP